MVTIQDLIRLPFTPDLSAGGIHHACHTLARNHSATHRSTRQSLRHIAIRTAGELAFRHILHEDEIPFQGVNPTPFTDPRHYDVSLGGHRCILTSYPISRQRQVKAIQADPSLLLKAQALVPIDQFASSDHRPDDILFFAFLLLGTDVAIAGDSAAPNPPPACWIHTLPQDWAYPKSWTAFHGLVMKSECTQTLKLEIIGMDAERKIVTTSLELAPRVRTPITQELYSISSIRAGTRPNARVGIHTPLRGDAYIIHPGSWDNIWLHGLEIWLTGWLTHEAFGNKASILKVGANTFQYDHTRIKNLVVPIHSLNACLPLFRRVKNWASEQSGKMPHGDHLA